MINSAAAGSTVSNQANFAFDADGNGSNESTGVTDDPTVAGAGNATSFAAAAAAAIPTLSQNLLLLLIGLLMLGSGVLLGRRRQR